MRTNGTQIPEWPTADHYHCGDACIFTGKTQVIAGGLFYVYTLIEGHRKGEAIYSQLPPKGILIP